MDFCYLVHDKVITTYNIFQILTVTLTTCIYKCYTQTRHLLLYGLQAQYYKRTYWYSVLYHFIIMTFLLFSALHHVIKSCNNASERTCNVIDKACVKNFLSVLLKLWSV